MATVLIADDEKSVRATLGAFLTDAGYDVIEAADGKEAKQCVDRQPPDVVLLDIHLGRDDGLDVARHIRDRQPGVRTILMTAEPNFASASQAIRLLKADRLRDYGLNTNPGPMATAAGIGGKSENSSGLSFITFKIGFGSMFLLTSNVALKTPNRSSLSCALQSAR